MRKSITSEASDWAGPGHGWGRWSARALLWWFIFPRRTQRTGVTLSGLLLVLLALGIGMAAYNSASNILFLTLSLLLACIILSGVLSAVNFRGLRWRIDVEAPLRVGQQHTAALVLQNSKSFLPTYSVWFEARVGGPTGASHELPLRNRLDAGSEHRLEFVFTPTHRGKEEVELVYVGSLFPFGFLRKGLLADTRRELIVWPAPVEYRRHPASAWQRSASGELVRRIGQSGDILALRRYRTDDSHRQIHWKASARLRQLMVRQMSAETGEAFSLWLDTSSELWPRAEQFELLCSFVATLAEDLFTAGRLRTAGLSGRPPRQVRRLADLERFLDELALVEPKPSSATVTPGGTDEPRPGRHDFLGTRNLLTFAPDGLRGVAAFVHGERAASA